MNPFEEVQWVQADEPKPRQFSREELRAFLNWKHLAACPLVCLFAKVAFWGRGRIEEMSNLRWAWIDAEGYIDIPDDAAKWGKGKVIRIPPALLDEMRRYEVGGPFVWAGYVDQLRAYHRSQGDSSSAHKIKDFDPVRLLRVFQKWIGAWASEAGLHGISHHAFRRTGLQLSREGKLRSWEAEFAKESSVSQKVAETNYTTDPRRLKAEITYRNIANEIRGDKDFAALMGLSEAASVPASTLEDAQAALAKGDIEEARRILALLTG